MNERIRRLLIWARGGKANPLSIELSPTLRCNLNCLFCWRYGKKVNYGEELAFEKYEEIVKEAASLDVREIRIIGGGEPLFRKDTFKLMQLVKSFGMFGYICTNGTLFGHEMIKHLVEIGWDRVKVSLHGASAATHDRLVGVNGSFEKVVSALKLFTFWKKRLGRDKPLLEIGVVLVKNNFKEIVKMVELAHKLEIQAFFLEPLTVYTEVGKRLRLSEEELEEFRKIVTEARRLVKKFNLESNLIGFEADVVGKTGKMEEVIRGDLETLDNDFLSAPCFEPWYRMGIRVDGIVCPCGFFDAESKENVKEKSLKEIWFGEYFDLRRRQILQKKLSPHCSKCCVTLVSTNKLIRDELKKFSLLLSKG